MPKLAQWVLLGWPLAGLEPDEDLVGLPKAFERGLNSFKGLVRALCLKKHSEALLDF